MNKSSLMNITQDNETTRICYHTEKIVEHCLNEYPTYLTLVFILMTAVGVLGLACNTLVIITIRCNPPHRSITNQLIEVLVWLDLIMALIGE